MLCSSDIGHDPGNSSTKSKYDADDWSVEVLSQAEALRRCTSSDGDDLSKSSIGTDRRRNRPPKSTQCRRRRRRHTEFSCDNEERDGTPNRLHERIQRNRTFQDSPHVRRFKNFTRT